MKKLLATLKNEDWVIVYAGAIILLLAVLFPEAMPSMPKKLADSASWIKAATMFASILGLTYLCQAVLRRLFQLFLFFLIFFRFSLFRLSRRDFFSFFCVLLVRKFFFTAILYHIFSKKAMPKFALILPKFVLFLDFE